MKTIAINRLNLIGTAKGKGLNAKQKATFIAELARMGYRITNVEALDSMSPSFLLNYKHLMGVLSTKRGGDVTYIPLFKSFPESVPDDDTYFIKRVMGFIGNKIGLFDKSVELSNGVKVPQFLFDVNDFGADPITQMQSKDLYDLAAEQNKWKKGDTHTEWIGLRIVDEEEMVDALKLYLQRLVYSKSAIKEELHEDLYRLLEFFGAEVLEPSEIVFKETQALVMHYFWKENKHKAITQLARTGTDLLRMFAAVTDTDISLSEKIKFPKLNRKARRMVLSVLEESPSLVEDVKKYKGLWLELGRYIHPGEYAAQFPRTAKVFDALRNSKLETYNSKTEKYLAKKDLDNLLLHLEEKPGVYARKLHEVLRKFPTLADDVIFSFRKVAAQMQLKNALVLKKYFQTINEEEYRTIVNKKGKIKVMPNNAKGALKQKTIYDVLEVLEEVIYNNIAAKETWKDQKVWIDGNLSNFTVPLKQRKASDGIITVGIGSRIAVDFTKVLRLFIYWKESDRRTDLDLSVMQFDKDFKYVGHVSYTNLKSDGIVHSGDIQSAPMGAAEFIDISMRALKEEVRYLAVQVYKYSGNDFIDMDCHAGWMMREKTSANINTFDIKTVANKFDLNGKGAYAIPLIVDIASKEIINTDLFVAGAVMHNNVEGSYANVSLICEQISKFIETKPTLLELSTYHTIARQARMVNTKEEADISFGYKDCTYNATEVETILSELI